MITNSIKHNFLVIGLTGPLNSGCSTAAKFFANNPQEVIDKIVSNSEQKLIEDLYSELAESSKGTQLNNKLILTKDKKRELNELLKKRELRKALSSHNAPVFKYISMSAMLLKYTVEYVLDKDIQNSDVQDYKKVIDIIRGKEFSRDKIINIKESIKIKKYRDISIEDWSLYDDYLKKIDELMEELKTKKDIKPETLRKVLQNFGDNIRKHGNPFNDYGEIKKDSIYIIAEQANGLIKFFRNRMDKENRISHFIIECFRNPYEVEYFRYRYYEFYLFSLFTRLEARDERGTKGLSSKELRGIDSRDSGEKNSINEIYKQNVSRCVYLSDISINNESSLEELYYKLIRYYTLIMAPGCITPTLNETFMNQAYSLSLRSSCLSRQVGAVIIGKNGYVVGAGWNDVGEGQIGCGYRHAIDIKNISDDILPTNPETEKSFRELIKNKKVPNECICFKDEYSIYILNKKFKYFRQKHKEEFEKLGTPDDQQKIIEAWLSEDIKIKRLEYCRALHAEENALLQTSKIGGVGVRGGKIFTTTFPCELCAKKIYQAGIKEIVYTEPYPESISKEVFLKDGTGNIELTQFEGVKSHSYFRLYKSNMDKKEQQEYERETAKV